ncbi:tRNA1(Val) (adenine(37)-N6)-methyltransferase [Pedobacter boryungensis]|uniref:tRNA1(Val) (adenine(37)-N6)-methyltransferase n=1 Tax=Pedobacter boryungensis TaxID=869962 RepID=A0ABX2D8V4_9SPHI|nr:methyltransferase [Pedobacter boryungensis]NQX30485.1 methyltransferase [Pedobacter boryungensis]
MSSLFKFKQFEVDQQGCAMKINTDGVLLAALVESDQPHCILDIGTGTGVIALMLAQRFNNAYVEAIEIDDEASKTADRNFKSSIFSNRLNNNNISIEQYTSAHQFDLIVSNPPYFTNDLKNTEEKKGIARHTNEEFFNDLIIKVNALLTENGSFWFVLPIKQTELLIDNGAKCGLSVAKQIHLHSDESKPEFRRIVCLKRTSKVPIYEHFYIYESEKVYTKAYKNLLKDFFLGY